MKGVIICREIGSHQIEATRPINNRKYHKESGKSSGARRGGLTFRSLYGEFSCDLNTKYMVHRCVLERKNKMNHYYRIYETKDLRHNAVRPLRVDVVCGSNHREVFDRFEDAVEFCKRDRQILIDRGMTVSDFAHLATRIIQPKKEFLYCGEVAI